MKIKKILTSLIAASMLFSSAITYVSAQDSQDLTDATDNTSSIISNEEKIPEIPVIKEDEKEESKSEERCCPTTSVSFTKLDTATDKPLEGATFTLYERTGCLLIGYDWHDIAISNGSSQISFSGLNKGHYKIKEKQAPSGYILSDAEYEFEMFYLLEDTFDATVAQNLFKNKPFPTISFTKLGKVKNETAPLVGAGFTLNKDGGEPSSQTSGTDGLVSFQITQAGSYTITEDSAPANYTVVTDPYTFTVDENGNTNFDREVVETHFINLYEEPIPVFPKTISFIKYGKTADNTLTPLSGAIFKLTKKDNPLPCIAQPNSIAQQEPACILAPAPVTSTSGSDGKVSFLIAKAGRYIIEEVSAPNGYTASTHKFEFMINEIGNVSYTAEELSVAEKGFINTKIITPPTPPTPPYTPTVSYGEAPIELIPYLEIITISEPTPAPPVSMPPKTGDTTLPIAIPTAMLLLATAMLIIKRKLAKED